MKLVDQHDKVRQGLLSHYAVNRVYEVKNERWKKHAKMEVRLTFNKPDQKSFQVISESGSKFIREHVIARLLKTEEAGIRTDSRKTSALTEENYTFTLLGEDVIRERDCYVIGVEPKRKEQMLISGRVYIDKEDLAVARIQGSPAKNPSFWVKRIEFSREYQKVGIFWVPASDNSLTQVRVFGPTLMSIQYGTYQLVPVQWLP